MSPTLEHPVVRAYLDELRRLLAGAPDRDLVLEGVTRHIEDALADGPADPARVQAVLDVLDELGDPAAIAAEATPAGSAGPVPFLDRRGGATLIVLLLAFGGYVVPLIGWIVGVVLLWNSKGWTRADKLVGTLTPLALVGLAAAVSALAATSAASCGQESCNVLLPTPWHVAVTVCPLLGGVLAAIYLLVRFRSRAA